MWEMEHAPKNCALINRVWLLSLILLWVNRDHAGITHTQTVHSKVRFSQGLWGMIQEIIATINKLKMKQRGADFIDFLMYSGSFNI